MDYWGTIHSYLKLPTGVFNIVADYAALTFPESAAYMFAHGSGVDTTSEPNHYTTSILRIITTDHQHAHKIYCRGGDRECPHHDILSFEEIVAGGDCHICIVYDDRVGSKNNQQTVEFMPLRRLAYYLEYWSSTSSSRASCVLSHVTDTIAEQLRRRIVDYASTNRGRQRIIDLASTNHTRRSVGSSS